MLYEELWKACAGPLVDVPQVGERVYYFPQGHMEQVSFILEKTIKTWGKCMIQVVFGIESS